MPHSLTRALHKPARPAMMRRPRGRHAAAPRSGERDVRPAAAALVEMPVYVRLRSDPGIGTSCVSSGLFAEAGASSHTSTAHQDGDVDMTDRHLVLLTAAGALASARLHAEHPSHHLDAVIGPLDLDELVRRPDSPGTRLGGHGHRTPLCMLPVH